MAAEADTTLEARLHWLKLERDRRLDELDAEYLPALTAMAEDWREAREVVYADYQQRVKRLA